MNSFATSSKPWWPESSETVISNKSFLLLYCIMTKKAICEQQSQSDGNSSFTGGFSGLPYLSAHPTIRCALICMLDDKRQCKYREGSRGPLMGTVLPRYWLYWPLILALPAAHNVRKSVSVVEATSLSYFVMAARTEYDTNYATGSCLDSFFFSFIFFFNLLF